MFVMYASNEIKMKLHSNKIPHKDIDKYIRFCCKLKGYCMTFIYSIETAVFIFGNVTESYCRLHELTYPIRKCR